MILLRVFVHTRTAWLSCNVQIFGTVGSLEFGWEPNGWNVVPKMCSWPTSPRIWFALGVYICVVDADSVLIYFSVLSSVGVEHCLHCELT